MFIFPPVVVKSEDVPGQARSTEFDIEDFFKALDKLPQ